MIRLVLLLMLLSATALGQTQQTFPAYVTSRAPATTPLSGQCFPVSNGVATTKLCSGYAVAIGALSAGNNLSDLGNPATARLNLFTGLPFGALNKCLGLDTAGNIISGPCAGQQTISAINLSNNTVIGGISGAPVGTISVSLSPPSPGFAGTLTVDDVAHFTIAGNTLTTNGALSSGNYPINITASEPASTSPSTQAFTIVVQALQSIALSNNNIVSGQPAGTIVGAITVGMTPASPPFAGSLSVTGANASNFTIVGNNLVTQGIVGNGNYNITIVASQGGAQISQAEVISATPQTISQLILSNTTVIGGSASANQLVGNIHVIMSPSTPAFSGSLSLSGTNASSFVISGGALHVGASNISNGSYSLNIVATAPGSSLTQAVTITAAATTWVNDQTQQMPYVCLTQIWINPSVNASGATGGGKLKANGGVGTQTAPYLLLSDGLAGATLTPGTCVNIVNAAALYDSFDTTTASQSAGFANQPDGFVVIRSTDNTGALVQAVTKGAGGVTIHSAASTWVSASSTHAVGQFKVYAPSDYWILDGLNIWMRGEDRTQDGLECLHVGTGVGDNAYFGVTHFQARNNYVHGCGAGAFAMDGDDYVVVQDNVCQSVTISQPQFQESCISYAAQASPNGYNPNGYDASLCTTLGGACQNYHAVISGNLLYDPYEALVPNSTDGNCIIIDTNIIAPGSTNAGAYLYRTLVINNIAFHCGGNGIYAFRSQHVDFVNNSVVRTNFDPHNDGSARNGAFCFNSNDCVMQNNLVYGIAANTSINITNTGTVISVDDVSGWLSGENTSGPPTPPSNSTPIPVLVNGLSANVVGVAINQTNISTTPGGISGTLTLDTPMSSPNGNSGVLVQATNTGFNGLPVLSFNIGAGDAGSTTPLQSCVNWSQPVPCAGGNIYSVSINGSSDFWQNNLSIMTQTSVSQPKASADADFCPSCAIPPTVTAPPGNNILNTDPLLNNKFFAVNPSYEMKSIGLANAGSNCTPGERITLLGGSPTTAATVQIGQVSNGHVLTEFLFDGGSYSSNSTTAFTEGSTTGTCSGVTFIGATFFQPLMSTSVPDVTLAGGSPALAAGNTNYCPSHNFFGSTRSCPTNIGAY